MMYRMQRRLKCAAYLVALMAVGAAGASEHRYWVSIDSRLERLRVKMCPGSPVPARVALGSTGFDRYLRGLGYRDRAGQWRPLTLHDGAVELAGLPAGACVAWAVAIGRAAGADPRGPVTRVGRDLIASPGAWMLRPELSAGDSLLVHFDLPQGVSVSVPWWAEYNGRYRVRPSPRGWRPVVAFGRFEVIGVPVSGAVLRVALLDGQPPLDEAGTLKWIRTAAEQVASVYGRFPTPNPQVVVVPVRGWGGFGTDEGRPQATPEPLPFARVLRDGGVAAQFFADQSVPLAAYLTDWTATHEFAHMLLPYVDRHDAWLSEGFASYYQNVLRARAGVLSERAAWQALHEGFLRGTRQSYDDTLAESIAFQGPNMVMRMYWSGAAIALLADVALRSAAQPDTLDGVLSRLQRCCLEPERTWEGRELCEQLDRLAMHPVFTDLYDRYVNSITFPDYQSAYRALGLIVRGQRVVLDERHPGAAMRRAIMAKREEPARRAR